MIPTSGRIRTRNAFVIALATLAPALHGCAVEWTREHKLYCRMDEHLRIRDTLYFGLSIPGGGSVTDMDWSRFESDVISRAFPRGFSVVTGRGSWRGADGTIVSEPSRIVVIVHDDDAPSDAAVRDVVQRYRTEFRQEAVLRERTATCVSL